MTPRYLFKFLSLAGFGAICLASLFLLNSGCGKKEPPLTKAAKIFKSKIQDELKIVTPALAQPVANQDMVAINKALTESFAKADQAGEPLPFKVVVLDSLGVLLARYPVEDLPVKRFSDYRAVKQVIKKKQIVSEVLYFADGSQAYVILAPLLFKGNLAGMVGFALKGDEVQDQWNVSSKEFQDINFNL